MSAPIDNSWLSERAKTWIVSITMGILVGGSLYGFYAAQVYKAEREEQKRFDQHREQMDRLEELKHGNSDSD